MKLTKEQKEKLATELSHPWGRVKLLCDGYEIDLSVTRVKANSIVYRTLTYVNGRFEGKWANAKEGEYPETKFLRKSIRHLYSPAERLKLEKVWGKRHVKNDKRINSSYVLYLPDWANGKTAINHLCKVCESVSLIEKTEPSEVI
ncbi:MAG: hypothetical protein NT086_02035 [Proteobacteria bacterium]|nr:hypothetical protein [Pseudomonadota bacterium]